MNTPKELGFSMPAEWQEHEATWISWPKDPDTFPKGIIESVEKTYCKIIEALKEGERIKIIVNDEKWEEKVREIMEKNNVSEKNVEFYQIKSVDIWTRDYASIFLINKTGKHAVTKWIYNAYGNKYDDLLMDNETGMKIAQTTKLPIYESNIVLEGGSIEVNGKGTLVTTEQCLLNKNRNPSLTKKEIEYNLKEYLGIDQIIWLKKGIEGDDTDGHVDCITRFVNEKTILTAIEENKNDPNYQILKTNYDILKKTDFEIETLPMPKRIDIPERRLPATYANFYIGNSAVLLPVFNDENDQKAIEILEDYFPKRKIVPIYANDLVYGYGGVHCATMQEPKI